MALSMTGYGRGRFQSDEMIITAEIKSVNHRYFELSSRIPRNCSFLDEKIRNLIQSKVTRGKIECNIGLETLESKDAVITVDHELARGYIDAYNDLSETYSLRNDLTASALARFPDVLIVRQEPADEQVIWNAVETALSEAIDNFIAMRTVEGKKLEDDIKNKSAVILDDVSFIEKRSPQTVKDYYDRLTAHMKELLSDASVDEQRVVNEAAVYADKIAVDEETVRLRSHISQLDSMFSEKEPVGRKMDFLVQEINREANTIGSKAQDTEIISHVLSIKAQVEKIREQVQNIE
jgi:uncharacterized protein (TIGR00255 family)